VWAGFVNSSSRFSPTLYCHPALPIDDVSNNCVPGLVLLSSRPRSFRHLLPCLVVLVVCTRRFLPVFASSSSSYLPCSLLSALPRLSLPPSLSSSPLSLFFSFSNCGLHNPGSVSASYRDGCVCHSARAFLDSPLCAESVCAKVCGRDANARDACFQRVCCKRGRRSCTSPFRPTVRPRCREQHTIAVAGIFRPCAAAPMYGLCHESKMTTSHQSGSRGVGDLLLLVNPSSPLFLGISCASSKIHYPCLDHNRGWFVSGGRRRGR